MPKIRYVRFTSLIGNIRKADLFRYNYYIKMTRTK